MNVWYTVGWTVFSFIFGAVIGYLLVADDK
jgi:hypothetical protein